ncbi:MAG: hypothetical protein U0414_28220 [Polyangiaceae bacterium]
MKKVAVLGSVLVLAFAAMGCKSESEKFADEVCACADKDCAMKVVDRLLEKHKDDDKSKKEKDSEADKKAGERAEECMKKLK